MIIDEFTVKKISETWWGLSWQATDLNLTSWVYVNAVRQGQYNNTTTLDRYTEFSVVEDSMNLIEIHEAAADDPVTTVNEGDPVLTYNKHLDSFDLHWDRVEDATYYNIYHQEAELPEELINSFAQNESLKYIYHTPVLNNIGGVWHHFRVESVDLWGNESTRELWHYFIYGMPSSPSNITIVAGTGSGLFDITVVE